MTKVFHGRYLAIAAFLVLSLFATVSLAGINYSSITSPSPDSIKAYVTASCTNVTGAAIYVNNTLKFKTSLSGGVVNQTVSAPAGTDSVVVKFWNSSGSVCAQTSAYVKVAAAVSTPQLSVAGIYNGEVYPSTTVYITGYCTAPGSQIWVYLTDLYTPGSSCYGQNSANGGPSGTPLPVYASCAGNIEVNVTCYDSTFTYALTPTKTFYATVK